MKECVVEVRRGALMDRVRHEGMRSRGAQSGINGQSEA